MKVGDLFLNSRHYIDPQSGEFMPKYFVILAFTPGEDLVVRLLTSQPHGRREKPPCSHSDPYPSYFFGVLGGRLAAKSWLDLRNHPDLESIAVERKLKAATIEFVLKLEMRQLTAAMECAAAAPDTTKQQETCIRDALSLVRK